MLRIYDSIDYALNLFNVPVCTYGGEKDPQLAASTEMAAAAKKLGVPVKLLIGPETGHKFHPDSFREFMAFHREHSEKGRRPYPGAREVRFITYTLKYNRCEWLTIEETLRMYEPAVVQAAVDARTGRLKLATKNVAVLQIARDIAEQVEIDGSVLPLASAAGGLLPGVFFERGAKEWDVLDYETSRSFSDNTDLRKRHNLQGPIDDAFMEPFVCVRGTGEPWSHEHADWAAWTLERFSREFDKYLRGRVPVMDDTDVTDETISDKNLILFGDPGSNAILARVLDRLPVRWDKDALVVGEDTYKPATHGLSMIYPNPLNPRRYVVINSGHTFHEKDFKASNSWLFPRLGDLAVQKYQRRDVGGYDETVVRAEIFDDNWQLPRKPAAKDSP